MNGADDQRVVRVFISSPNDVAIERSRAQAVAGKLSMQYEGLIRFETVLWEEHFFKADSTFQAQIEQPAACDIVLAIFWARIGTELPGEFARMADGRPYPSGTAYELLTALDASKVKGVPDVYVFRKTADVAIPTTNVELRLQAQTQLDALEAFWREWFKAEEGQFRAAFHTFTHADVFERQLEQLLRQWLETHGYLGTRLVWPKEKGSPFRGLAAFEAEHAAVFFGRDRVVEEARRRLTAAAEHGTPFLLIVGPSGAGKSSLARAGVIPRVILPGAVTQVDVWRVAQMKPSDDRPLLGLAASLFAALPELSQSDFPTIEMLANNFGRGGDAAVRPVTRALARVAKATRQELGVEREQTSALILLVDQMEELFAQRIDEKERVAFANCLALLVATRFVWCVTTLRADLYEMLLKQPALKALKDEGSSIDVVPPALPEVAEIIRAPAIASGLLFEHEETKGDLDQRLLADAKFPDSLALLQFTLQQLYERRVDTGGRALLTHAAYEDLGGLVGAIAREAERAEAKRIADDEAREGAKKREERIRDLISNAVNRSSRAGEPATGAVSDADSGTASPIQKDFAQYINVLYATNRVIDQNNDDRPITLYSVTYKRSQTLNFGSALVRVPEEHKIGEVERPTEITILGFRMYKSRMTVHYLSANSDQSAMVFVHGFDTRFEDAISRPRRSPLTLTSAACRLRLRGHRRAPLASPDTTTTMTVHPIPGMPCFSCFT
jgi:eukaryotic-like serine/threonine-protein kinase